MDFEQANPDFNRRLLVSFAIMGIVGGLAGFDNYAVCDDNTLQRIQAGTIVTPKQVGDWSNLLLVTTPKIHSGDKDKVAPVVLRYASMFSTVIAVDVEPQGKRYHLRAVGFAMAMREGEHWRTVSADESESSSAGSLDLIARKVLAASEQSLDQLKVVFRAGTAIIIDSPAIIAVDDVHREMTVRHLIWIQPDSGHVSSAIWAIESSNPPKVLDDKAVLLPPGLTQTRTLRVDQEYFFLGIPTAKAFAMESLPAGVALPFGQSVAAAACSSQPSVEDLAKIAEQLMTIAPGAKRLPIQTKPVTAQGK